MIAFGANRTVRTQSSAKSLIPGVMLVGRSLMNGTQYGSLRQPETTGDYEDNYSYRWPLQLKAMDLHWRQINHFCPLVCCLSSQITFIENYHLIGL